MEIIEKKAHDAWKKVLKYVLEKGESYTHDSGRRYNEVLNVSVTVEEADSAIKLIEIMNSFKQWVYLPLEELDSMIMSRKEIPGYYYNYGVRTFNFSGINQIDNYIIPLLRKNPTSRRAIIVFYDPKKDSSMAKKDTPCLISISFNLRENKLYASAIIRSSDLFFGLPANFYQIRVLQNYIAKEIGCEAGSITMHLVSAHIREQWFDEVRKL